MRGVPQDARIFFFFQAEDGIRDYKVTGVQTCALPISRRSCSPSGSKARGRRSRRRSWTSAASLASAISTRTKRCSRRGSIRRSPRDRKSVVEGKRVDLGGGRIIKKKKRGSRGGRWQRV